MRPYPTLLLGLLALLLATGLALQLGPVTLDWNSTGGLIFWELRLPRILLALVAGAALALSGAWLQSLLHNPLADPSLLGISAGAALGAVGVGVGLGWPQAIPLGALLGGWGLAWLSYRLAQQAGQLDLSGLLLVGLTLNALAGALLGLILALSGDTQLRQWLFWQWGSLAGAHWFGLIALALVLLLALALSLRWARALDALLLGPLEATYLGVAVSHMQRRGLLLVALLAGGVTALTGIIGFIGLIAPHLARLCVGAEHRYLLPLAALLGAGLLLGADTLARTLLAPAELPLGILTALVGSPVFLLLWWRSVRHVASP